MLSQAVAVKPTSTLETPSSLQPLPKTTKSASSMTSYSLPSRASNPKTPSTSATQRSDTVYFVGDAVPNLFLDEKAMQRRQRLLGVPKTT